MWFDGGIWEKSHGSILNAREDKLSKQTDNHVFVRNEGLLFE
jgi:hypothetical protein